MEKRGVIDDNTPSGTCCGGKEACGETGTAGVRGESQQLLKFAESIEPDTEKEADDIESSLITDAINVVAEETDKSDE
jgi:hypothetical protein